MGKGRILRHTVVAVALLLGVYWSALSARHGVAGPNYPAAEFITSPGWLAEHREDPHIIIVDVREDKYFDGKVIPGAIRLPWGKFRYTDAALGIGGMFVGVVEAQRILGIHGIARTDTIVLYDSVERDGGATASYVFWVLDVLGHEKKKILDRGIDGWIDAGGGVSSQPTKRDAILYQALSNQIDLQREVDGEFIYTRLGDPYYQIIDVRSRAEYLGETPDMGLDGKILKLGHVPTAVNVDYRLNWADSNTKALKGYAELQDLYRGLDPSKAVILYCHSARRSSFTYFVLRLMGVEDVRLYDRSWFEWGNERSYYPVETRENQFQVSAFLKKDSRAARSTPPKKHPAEEPLERATDGYVSCGG
jgi:thiosulfate/3-mercaptopyruvate sulfurtransferase